MGVHDLGGNLCHNLGVFLPCHHAKGLIDGNAADMKAAKILCIMAIGTHLLGAVP